MTARVKVVERLKGANVASIGIVLPLPSAFPEQSHCRVRMSAPGRYFIYAYPTQEGDLLESRCFNATRTLGEAKADLAFARQQRKSVKSTDEYLSLLVNGDTRARIAAADALGRLWENPESVARAEAGLRLLVKSNGSSDVRIAGLKALQTLPWRETETLRTLGDIATLAKSSKAPTAISKQAAQALASAPQVLCSQAAAAVATVLEGCTQPSTCVGLWSAQWGGTCLPSVADALLDRAQNVRDARKRQRMLEMSRGGVSKMEAHAPVMDKIELYLRDEQTPEVRAEALQLAALRKHQMKAKHVAPLLETLHRNDLSYNDFSTLLDVLTYTAGDCVEAERITKALCLAFESIQAKKRRATLEQAILSTRSAAQRNEGWKSHQMRTPQQLCADQQWTAKLKTSEQSTWCKEGAPSAPLQQLQQEVELP